MKKYFLLALLCSLWGLGGLSAQVTVSNMATDYTAKQVSFTVTWTAQPHNNQIWVIVDYIKVQNASTAGNSWKRALVTAVARNAGTGSVATVTGQRGFWLNTSGSSGSANVTATLSPDAGVQQFNWCAYPLNHPPKAELQSDGSYKLYGTPPFTVNGTALPAGVTTIDPGTCITSLADATDNPSHDLPMLTISTSNPAARCGEGAVTLTATASGGVTSSMTYTWTVAGDEPQTTYEGSYTPVIPVGGADYSVAVTNAAGCTATPETGTITVHALPTITPTATNICQAVIVGSAITQIKYSTANANGASITGLPTGVTGAWANNTYTISGTPAAIGKNNYTVTTINSNGCTNATAEGMIGAVASLPPYSSGLWANYSQIWSGKVSNLAHCFVIDSLTGTKLPSWCIKIRETSSGYYYNWTCAAACGDELCPPPWRVPTYDDGLTLYHDRGWWLLDQTSWQTEGLYQHGTWEDTGVGRWYMVPLTTGRWQDWGQTVLYVGSINPPSPINFTSGAYLQLRCVQ
ncbi:MAG: fibrobacter succinogenes major paralogous domain-containing protein [Prevotellaceae bacterium]|jgi:hypothetical protein|nr:fibrobacter succinogenes major paralogous domain-containing protein [Prevotellaceae bacterium]